MSDLQHDLAAENASLRQRLEEAEATLDAIRNGHIDALVVGSPEKGDRVYTLEGAEHPYRVLIEAMHQGAVTLGDDGTILYCNATFAQMVGRPLERIVGGAFVSFFPRAGKAVVKDVLRDALTSPQQAEMRLQRSDGTLLPITIAAGPLPLSDLSAMSVIVTDLTGQKRYQDLQDIDRRKDEFLAMLAHELRNPLAPIANAVQMLCLTNGDADSELRWTCELIDRQVQQMTSIVDDLLDVSRITRGKITLHMQPVAVSAIVNRAVETSRPLIESCGHSLQITLPSETLRVEGDEARLAQCVTNLLNNAAKYTDTGGLISLNVEREGSDAMVKVRDTGVGLSAEMLSSVFDLFMQVDRSLDRSQGGLGIGLTLVRSLVEMHGGSVSASSGGPGQGSEFVVRLPLLAAPAPALAAAVPDTAGSVSRRVLIVDDNKDAAKTLAMLMKLAGHETHTCFDGPSALEAAHSFRPEVVLLDIGLPGMNGYVVAEHLRQDSGVSDAVLIALTGYGAEEDRRRSQEAGFDHHFVKPVSYPQLKSLLDSLEL